MGHNEREKELERLSEDMFSSDMKTYEDALKKVRELKRKKANDCK